ncbi:MAG: VOC family protein [Puniceicoccaceae bacterium]|nr:MAG: VOC family protein [Puniceicoccaceae bacterium]
MPSITGVHHIAISVADFDASVRFYTDVLGLKVRITWDGGSFRAAMIDFGDGNYAELFSKGRADSDKSPLLHFALRTDDCVSMLEKVRSAGMEVTMEPKAITIKADQEDIPVKIAFFKGPDGELIELFENEKL